MTHTPKGYGKTKSGQLYKKLSSAEQATRYNTKVSRSSATSKMSLTYASANHAR